MDNEIAKPSTTAPYFIGLDMGTNSLGFAVTDPQYNVIRKSGRHLWGFRRFNQAKTAADTRAFRTARRRLRREKERVRFLQSIFKKALEEKDRDFLQRLQDSFFYPDDKKIEQKYSLFADPEFSDIDYHKHYPTIYHLRDRLMKNSEPADVRLVYLALLHIMKNRGHFLFAGNSYDSTSQYSESFEMLSETSRSILGWDPFPIVHDDLKFVLCHQGISRTKRSDLIKGLLLNHLESGNKRQITAFVKLLAGLKVNLATLFDDESLKEAERKDCNLAEDYEAIRPTLEEVLGSERLELIDAAYNLFSWARLTGILGDFQYLSEAKIATYEKHREDLRRLKSHVKMCDKQRQALKLSENNNSQRNLYDEIFNISDKKLNNYVAYTGHLQKRGKKQSILHRNRDQGEFLKFLKTRLSSFSELPNMKELLAEIDEGLFLPILVGTDNGTIPRQVVSTELKLILRNASKYLDFLDEDACNKLLQMFEFRIPYYVGPLNPAHRFDKEGGKYAWVVRKESGHVYPWNFHEKVDEERSAEIFIERMTRGCSYLKGEKALPKQSPLYAEFMLRNIVNAININGRRLDNELRGELIEDLFLNNQGNVRVTRKRVRDWLSSRGAISQHDELGGFDLDIPIRMTAWHDFQQLTKSNINLHDMEEIVRIITIFPDDKRMIQKRLENQFRDKLHSDDIKLILTKRYRDWGNLSRRFLSEMKGEGEADHGKSIIDMMRENPVNLMELMSDKYSFASQVSSINRSSDKTLTKLEYGILDDYMISPPVKRMIWQTLLVYRDIEKIMGGPPRKIFVEVARGGDETNKERTKSRKIQLIELYNNCIKDADQWGRELYGRLQNENEKALFSKKLFLYYLQQGRCAYSAEPIILEDLESQLYDIDHIYPRSLTKDDSPYNNLVLVKASLNRQKGDQYPLPETYQKNAANLWYSLHNQGFMKQEKYARLTRTVPLTIDELSNFINRQLVETNQAVKTVTDVFERVLGDESSVIYVKARHVSDFRYYDARELTKTKDNEGIPFVKCREINDIHHAKDAYLNVVVGNVLDEKFTKNPHVFLEKARPSSGERYSYNLAKIYQSDVPYRKGDYGLAWQAGPGGTIQTIKKVMGRNDVLYTEQTSYRTDGFFDQQIKGKMNISSTMGKVPIKGGKKSLRNALDVIGEPTSTKSPYTKIERYGAYDKELISYYALVDSLCNNKWHRSIEPIPLTVATLSSRLPHKAQSLLKQYFLDELGASDVRILLERIPFNSVFEINGYRCRIRGKTGNSYRYLSHIQPFYSLKREIELTQVHRCLNNIAKTEYERADAELRELMNQQSLEMLSDVDLDELLAYLLDRLYSGPWKNAQQINRISIEITSKMEHIRRKSVIEKCICIIQLVKIMGTTEQYFDLTCFDMSKTAGARDYSKKMNRKNNYVLVTQSPSGFFENKIDLWKL